MKKKLYKFSWDETIGENSSSFTNCLKAENLGDAERKAKLFLWRPFYEVEDIDFNSDGMETGDSYVELILVVRTTKKAYMAERWSSDFITDRDIQSMEGSV